MSVVVLLGALAALSAWPAFQMRASAVEAAAGPTPAPLRDDVTIRAKSIAFEETRAALDPEDQITPRLLAEQYLQRYRERGDPDDVRRAEAAARRSLRLQPRRNVAALQELASAQLALHRFSDALATIRTARSDAPNEPSLAAAEAALHMELGDYAAAQALVVRFASRSDAMDSVAARLAELTGDLPRARGLLARASLRADASYGIPNERRAWFHMRLGELAFEAGDTDRALGEERTALERFPDDVQALTNTARFEASAGRWHDARAAAERAVRLAPAPEALALLADAQSRLGEAAAARASQDELDALARIGNAQHLFDRLLALAYADRSRHLDQAYAIARRELSLRDDVFAEDTLAWTAARSGRWSVARTAAARATRIHVSDPRVWYHAGVVAEHFGDRRAAAQAYRHALGLNPRFDAVFADDARRRLALVESEPNPPVTPAR